ncbi:MAG TPA: diacylglycerol kinase family protein [Cellulomonas sp.]|uniref:diacylglycerol/lipid kinase family protein n=1 Tax=Cellulomonas sp. TaxID=40001 RepID=UPI002E307AC7|nr:diacylglycerol kinase family protein [Cellulomonas sp.]HEX5331127.1 diacylglycerol kinase family protein [Cellulomonas sp.]
MSWWAWVAIAAAVLAVAALVLGIVLLRRQQELRGRLGLDGRPPQTPGDAQAAVDGPEQPGRLIAFVANPTKPDVEMLRKEILVAVADGRMPEMLWLETSVEDPGVGQARQAVAAGADIVVAMGGDGTVRAVAEALVGTGVPMGLLPLGTGNLLARNLDLPIGNPLSALEIALTGIDRAIDVGWVRILDGGPGPVPARAGSPVAELDPMELDPTRWPTDADPDDDAPGDELSEHIFLVIAGLGFDAAMVADTDLGLKARVGWIAYFMSGVRHLHGRRLRALVRLDDRPPTALRLRSLLVGNCGRLPGGLTLLPDAVLDDGWLDVAAIDTRGGVAGWAQLFGEVVLQGVGVRAELPAKIGRIDHARARRVLVRVSTPEHVQVDGDVIGTARALSAHIQAGGLVVRVPKP